MKQKIGVFFYRRFNSIESYGTDDENGHVLEVKWLKGLQR